MGRYLIVGIDLQDGFLSDEIKQSDYVQKVETFLSTQPKDDIVLTRFVNLPNSSFEKFMDWPKMQAVDPAIRLFGSLESQDYQILEKPGYSAWSVVLQQKVEAGRYDAIVLFGLDAEACVLKTALDIFDAGKQPIILEDLCHSSNGVDRHHMAMELMRSLLGVRQVISSEDL